MRNILFLIVISTAAYAIGSNNEVASKNAIVFKTGSALTDRGRFDSSGNLLVTSLSTSTALYADGSKNIKSSSVTATELGYLSGVTSGIQNQLATKLNNSIGSVSSAHILDATIVNGDIANSTIDLTAKVTGVLPFANGGTNASTSTAAINGLLPSQSGNSGKVLTSNGTNVTWGTASVGSSNWKYHHFNTFAGYGATDTKIPYFTNTDDSASNANVYSITTNNSTNGLSITVNSSIAEVCIGFTCQSDASANICGISVNSTQLTTTIESISVNHRKAMDYARGSSTVPNGNAFWCGRASSGDVIRPHTSGNATGASSEWAFSIFAKEL